MTARLPELSRGGDGSLRSHELNRGGLVLALGIGLIAFLWAGASWAGPGIAIDFGEGESTQVSAGIKMMVVLTLLSLAPAILMTSTSFVRFVVVFSFLRNALGTQSAPPNQVLLGLALFMTAAVMAPVGSELHQEGLQPYLDGQLGGVAAYEAGVRPLRHFMLKQTREKDLALFYEISAAPAPAGADDVGMHLLLPAFVISELRTAFEMGFTLFMPFILLDLIIASVLMSMGMVMLPPALVSLPVKVMLFVLADGWNLLVGSLVRSF